MNPSFNAPAVSAVRSRNLALAAAVVALHAGALWALQSGLLRRAVETVVPVQVLAEFLEPARPSATPAPPAPPAPHPSPQARPTAQTTAVPVPQPQALASAEPAPTATMALTSPTPEAATSAPVPRAPPATGPAAPPAPPAPPRVELPSSHADYLNNPRPAYPPLSKRLNEQGEVVVRAHIEVDGRASRAEVVRSSGFDRLDQAGVQTVLTRWRFVPGKRNGVPEAMWVNVPINFVLE